MPNFSHVTSNQMTYSNLVRAASFLLPRGPDRNKIVSSVFQKATAAGMVDAGTIRALERAVDADVFNVLTEGVGESRIPPQWNKNVQPF